MNNYFDSFIGSSLNKSSDHVVETANRVKLDLNIVINKIHAMLHTFLSLLPEMIIGMAFFLLFIFLDVLLAR